MLSLFLWFIVAFVSFPMLISTVAMILSRNNRSQIESLRNTTYTEIPFLEFPMFVKFRMKKDYSKAKNLGFYELASYSRQGIGMENYTVIFLSPDQNTYLSVEYVAMNPLVLFILMFIKPSDCFDFILGFSGTCVNSAYGGDRRLITTTYKMLARDHQDGVKEFNILSARLSLGEIYQNHKEASEKLKLNQNLTFQNFSSKQDFFNFDTRIMKKLSERLEDDFPDSVDGIKY